MFSLAIQGHRDGGLKLFTEIRHDIHNLILSHSKHLNQNENHTLWHSNPILQSDLQIIHLQNYHEIHTCISLHQKISIATRSSVYIRFMIVNWIDSFAAVSLLYSARGTLWRLRTFQHWKVQIRICKWSCRVPHVMCSKFRITTIKEAGYKNIFWTWCTDFGFVFFVRVKIIVQSLLNQIIFNVSSSQHI